MDAATLGFGASALGVVTYPVAYVTGLTAQVSEATGLGEKAEWGQLGAFGVCVTLLCFYAMKYLPAKEKEHREYMERKDELHRQQIERICERDIEAYHKHSEKMDARHVEMCGLLTNIDNTLSASAKDHKEILEKAVFGVKQA